MASLKRFEDIEAWQKARVLTREVYRITSQGRLARDFGLRDQIRRASVSIMANIAEGFERGGDAEFRQFLSVAKGSAGEVKAHLYVALDAELITQDQFDRLYSTTQEVGRRVAGFIRYLGNSKYSGIKYKKETSEP